MSALRNVYYRLPISWRKMLRKFYYLPSDLVGKNKRPFHVPPDGDNFIGPGDFEKIGQEFFELSKELGNITPGDRILEIGCGMGRMAFPYKAFLSEKGSYVGMDIVEEGIEWCRNRIAPNDSRFQFILADIKNDLYNPNGKFLAREYVFPFEANQFDYIFLTSVFTHMLPEEIDQYISEISRVLKKGGRVMATFFLINKNVEELIASKKSMFSFDVDFGSYRTISKQVKESNVAIDESYLLEKVEKSKLMVEGIHYGSWCGRSDYLTFQDAVILTSHD